MGENKRKRGRKPKTPVADTSTMDFQYTSTSTIANPTVTTTTTTTNIANDVVSVPTTGTSDLNNTTPSRRGRGRPRKTENQMEIEAQRPGVAVSPKRRSTRNIDQNGDAVGLVAVHSEPPLTAPKWESVVRVVPSMDAVVKVFCVHTEPNFSLPWQRKRQYSSSSSGFIVGGRRVLTNAHSVEHHTQVKLKKRGSDTKYLATVLAIGTECDIGMEVLYFFFFLWFQDNFFIWGCDSVAVLSSY